MKRATQCSFCLTAMLLSEIGFQQLALLSLQAAYRFFFNLTHALTREVEFRAYFFKGHFLAAYAEKHFKNLSFAFVQLAERSVNLLAETLLGKGGVGHRGVVVGQHVKQTVVLAFNKRSVYRNVAS